MAPFVRYAVLVLGSAAALVTALSCGGDDAASSSAEPDSGSSGVDGSSGGSSGNNGGSDAGTDGSTGPRCDPTKPFGAPVPLLEGSFLIDQGARLSPDELTLYYASYGTPDVNGQTDLWTATRASVNVPFKNPTKIAELSTAENELEPTVTADGLTIYYEGKVGSFGIIRATRPSLTAPWESPTLIAGLDLIQIFVAPDGKRLYGVKDGNTSSALVYVDLPYDGGVPTEIPGSGYGGRQYWPVMSADALTLYSSHPQIQPYRWILDVRTRASTADSFGTVQTLKDLDIDASADQNATWISPDDCTIYFRRVNANLPGNASGLLQATRGK